MKWDIQPNENQNNDTQYTIHYAVSLMLRVVHAKFMLSVANKTLLSSVLMLIDLMLSVLMLSVIMLNFVAPNHTYLSIPLR